MPQTSLKELRVFSTTTFNTSHTAPNDDAWLTTNATKLRVISVDESGLTVPGIPDTTIRSRMHAQQAPFNGLRKGSLKFTTYLTGGNATAAVGTADAITNMMSVAFGNIATCATKEYVIQAGTTSSNVILNSIDASAQYGGGIFFPSTGEARIINVMGTNHVTLNMELSATPTGNAVLGHSVFFDQDQAVTWNKYTDWLLIKGSGDHQFQGVGAVPSFTLASLGAGEAPTIEWELQTADVNMTNASPASLNETAVPQGNDPTGKYQGGLYIQNTDVITRKIARAGDITINPNIKWVERPDLDGVNGINGWARDDSMPEMEFTLLSKDMAQEMYSCFQEKQEKCVMIQFGKSRGACVMIHAAKFVQDEAPIEAALGMRLESK